MIRHKKDFKNAFILLFIIIVINLYFGYALLNSTITINGTSKIEKNIWDVHFENIMIRDGSVTATTEPLLSNNTTISKFELMLDKPGNFYEFTVDVVNNGTIDAMLDSVVKIPDLTDEQKKYVNYIIEYQNEEQIVKNN